MIRERAAPASIACAAVSLAGIGVPASIGGSGEAPDYVRPPPTPPAPIVPVFHAISGTSVRVVFPKAMKMPTGVLPWRGKPGISDLVLFRVTWDYAATNGVTVQFSGIIGAGNEIAIDSDSANWVSVDGNPVAVGTYTIQPAI